jgi:signal transduction histidine kinase
VAARRWLLFDAAVAVGLIVSTVGQRSEADPGAWWWVLVTPLAVGLLIRRRRPLLAFALAGFGALIRHLDPSVELDMLDLAVPLTLYTLASSGRSRRTAAVALASAVVLVGLASLLNVMIAAQERPAPDTKASGSDAGALQRTSKFGDPGSITDQGVDPSVLLNKQKSSVTEPPPSVGQLLSAAVGQGLGVMLVLGLAVAVGDSVRSRRAHLHAVEQRAADLEREQHQRVALATAAERARISRELHDVVAHGLSVIVVQAQGAAAALRRHPDRAADALQNVITTGRDSLTEMRRLLDLVRRDPTEESGLAPQFGVGSLPALIDRVRAAGTPVSFTVDGEPVPLPPGVDLSAYRITQEALTNTIKHAGPGASASVRLAFRPDRLEIEVSDDGVGGPVPLTGDGTGLRGIAERIAMLGGEWTAGPGPSAGFRVWARLPLEPAGGPA